MCTWTERQPCVSQSKDRRKQRMFTSVIRNVSLSCSQTYTSLFTFGQNLIIRLPSHLSLFPWLAQGSIPSPERYTYLPFSPSTCPLAKVAQICVKKTQCLLLWALYFRCSRESQVRKCVKNTWLGNAPNCYFDNLVPLLLLIIMLYCITCFFAILEVVSKKKQG